jgi:hypothetical protein
MTTYRNVHFTRRDYETTNVVACQAEVAPNANYVACDDTILRGLTKLWIERGVQYFGYL